MSASMSVADEIAKLNKLRNDGAITDAEFQQQKEALFRSSGAPPNAAPVAAASAPNDMASIQLKNKWWFQAIIIWLIIPVGIILMLFCTAYQKRKGEIVRVGKGTKAIIIVLASLLWALGLARLFADPNFQQQVSQAAPANNSTLVATAANTATEPETQTPTAEPEATAELPSCDSAELQNTVKQAVGDKLAMMGLPAGSLGDMYGQLKESHSEPSEAIKRNFSRQNGIPLENIEMCSVSTDSGEMLVTLVAMRDGKIGGAVGNFGAPGAVANFGDME